MLIYAICTFWLYLWNVMTKRKRKERRRFITDMNVGPVTSSHWRLPLWGDCSVSWIGWLEGREHGFIRATCRELKPYLFKALVFSTFTYGTIIWEGKLKNFHYKGFREGHEGAYDVSCQSAVYDYLSNFVGQILENFPYNYTLSNSLGLSTMACPPIPLYIYINV